MFVDALITVSILNFYLLHLGCGCKLYLYDKTGKKYDTICKLNNLHKVTSIKFMSDKCGTMFPHRISGLACCKDNKWLLFYFEKLTIIQIYGDKII